MSQQPSNSVIIRLLKYALTQSLHTQLLLTYGSITPSIITHTLISTEYVRKLGLQN